MREIILLQHYTKYMTNVEEKFGVIVNKNFLSAGVLSSSPIKGIARPLYSFPFKGAANVTYNIQYY